MSKSPGKNERALSRQAIEGAKQSLLSNHRLAAVGVKPKKNWLGRPRRARSH